jgi:multiple sugar transport system permease protein
LFIFPDCIGLLVFVAIPIVLTLSLGFFSVDGFGGYKFVGLANYNRMLRDPLFMKSLGVTIVYVLCLVPGSTSAAWDLRCLCGKGSRWSDFGGLYFSCPTLSAWLSLH